MKMPPGTPLPKLVEVNTIFTTTMSTSKLSDGMTFSAMRIICSPPPRAQGKKSPTGSATRSDRGTRDHCGSLL